MTFSTMRSKHLFSGTSPRRLSILPGVIALSVLLYGNSVAAQQDLAVAAYTDAQQLRYPDNMDQWIHMGTTLGGDYSTEAFDPAHPGTLGVVLMEPEAYRYFREHGDYADGTMFLLSFYNSETKSDPRLQGFVQGELRAQEIHVIDRQRFAEGSAFFLFPLADHSPATRLDDGSDCIRCHTAEGEFRSTFIQFYPTIRSLPRSEGNPAR